MVDMTLISTMDRMKVVLSTRFATSKYDSFESAMAAIIALGIIPNEILFKKSRKAKFMVNNFLRNLSIR